MQMMPIVNEFMEDKNAFQPKWEGNVVQILLLTEFITN